MLNRISKIIKKIFRSSSIPIIGMALSLVTALISSSLPSMFNRMTIPITTQVSAPQEISDRIEAVTGSLRDSSKTLASIQVELEEKIRKAQSLKQEVDDAKSFLSLSDNEVSAVKELLSKEIDKNSTRDFWISLIMNFLFFILGALTTVFLPRIKSWLSMFRKLKQSK